jgi:hypothetical protein
MKFTSALSAIALVLFAQTVAASPASLPRSTSTNLPNQYVQLFRIETSNNTLVKRTTVIAEIVDIQVNTTNPHPDLIVDTVITEVGIESADYIDFFFSVNTNSPEAIATFARELIPLTNTPL